MRISYQSNKQKNKSASYWRRHWCRPNKVSNKKLSLSRLIPNACLTFHWLFVNNNNNNNHLTALCLGQPSCAGTRKVKPIWIYWSQRQQWQWHQLGHMQICTSHQTDNHASIPPLSFHRSGALPAIQPTVSSIEGWLFVNTKKFLS